MPFYYKIRQMIYVMNIWWPGTLLKKTPMQVFSCEIFERFNKIYFEEHLRAIASTNNQYLKARGVARTAPGPPPPLPPPASEIATERVL